MNRPIFDHFVEATVRNPSVATFPGSSSPTSRLLVGQPEYSVASSISSSNEQVFWSDNEMDD